MSLRPSSRRSRPFSLALAALVLGGAAACNSTKPPKGIDNDGLVTARLVSVNPRDIVVLPIDNRTGRTDLPLAAIREAFHKGLVRQRYSPLSLEYIDRNLAPYAVDATYRPGSLQEEGVLQVVITNWDDSDWRARARLVIDADIYLLDAAGKDLSQALWGGHVTRTVDVLNVRATTINQTTLLKKAAEKFVNAVVDSLPPRDPERVSG